jgi:hypothetical protein
LEEHAEQVRRRREPRVVARAVPVVVRARAGAEAEIRRVREQRQAGDVAVLVLAREIVGRQLVGVRGRGRGDQREHHQHAHRRDVSIAPLRRSGLRWPAVGHTVHAMPARSPRRTFASPFIITIAAVPACFVSSSTPPSQPISQAAPGQPSQSDPAPTPPPPQEQSPVIVANPPRPTQGPAEQAATPPPPPPQPTPTPVNPSQPNQMWTVLKTTSGCEAILDVSCPQGASCNPPAPIKYACPDGVKLPAKITTFGDSCAVVPPEMHCPPHAMCNPPRPQKVACPKR